MSGSVLQPADDGLLRTTRLVDVTLKVGDRVMLRIDDCSGYHTLVAREPGVDVWRCDHS